MCRSTSSISLYHYTARNRCQKQLHVYQSRKLLGLVWGLDRNPREPIKSQWCWIAPGVLLRAVHLKWCATIGPDLSTLSISSMVAKRKAIRDLRKSNVRLGSPKAGHSQRSPKTAKCHSQCEHTPLQRQNQWSYMRHQSPVQRPACLLLGRTIWMWNSQVENCRDGFHGFSWCIPTKTRLSAFSISYLFRWVVHNREEGRSKLSRRVQKIKTTTRQDRHILMNPPNYL